MTPESLASLAAILLSLLASYLPGFSPWYACLDPTPKRLVMALLLLAICLAVFAAACFSWGDLFGDAFGLAVACSQKGAFLLLRLLVAALVSNQAAFLLSPKRSDLGPGTSDERLVID